MSSISFIRVQSTAVFIWLDFRRDVTMAGFIVILKGQAEPATLTKNVLYLFCFIYLVIILLSLRTEQISGI